MLKSVDILLGVTMVMLVVSLIVTVLTQFVSSVRDTRGKNLWKGLTSLLEQIDPNLKHDAASTIARQVLTHPMIRSGTHGLGDIIHREELTKILLELASGTGRQTLESEVQAQLVQVLKSNGIDDPKAAMENIRKAALEIEANFPELSNAQRYSRAILLKANSDFVAKINGWFDPVIDRVASRFTLSTRRITFACGLLIAVLLQLDTVALFSRLSMDDALRADLVRQAIKIDNTKAVPATGQFVPALSEGDREAIRKLAKNDLISVPGIGYDWETQWSWSKIPGILISSMLLSFGAPFWYNALKNLLRLRSLVAEKDDNQRAERQTAQPPAPLPVTLAPPPAKE